MTNVKYFLSIENSVSIAEQQKKIINDLVVKINHKSKNGRLVFNLNHILDAFYANELYKYINDSYQHIKTLNKDNLFVNIIDFLNNQQSGVQFDSSFFQFINTAAECGNIDIIMLERALKSDIQLIFVNGAGNVKKNSVYIDEVISQFYRYLSNTLFRNFVVIYINLLVKHFDKDEEFLQQIQPFLLDILSNNRKINTIISSTMEMTSSKMIVYPILTLLLKKVEIKGSSLFSNQLRFFGYRKIKFIKDKERGITDFNNSFDADFLNKSNEINNQFQSLGFTKSDSVGEIFENLTEILKAPIDSENKKQNICELILKNFKGNKGKIKIFFDRLPVEHPDLYIQMGFYISDLLDMFE